MFCLVFTMKRCAEWQKRLSQFKLHRRTLTVYWGKQDLRCSKSRNVSLKFSCRIWFGILCETSIKKTVIWSAKLICLPLSLAQSLCHLLNQLKNDPHRDSVVRVFSRAFSMMRLRIFALCFYWLVKFLPLLWLAAITWLKMVFCA